MSAKVLSQYVAALSASGGAFIGGTLAGWSSPAPGEVLDGTLGIKVSEEEFSWVSSSLTIGGACTCIPVGFVVNTIGRKITMLLITIPVIAGWLMLLWGRSLPLMYIGRFLLGVGAGTFCVTAPLYTGEIAQKEIRGKLGAFFRLMITTGILFVYAAGAFMHVVPMSMVCVILPFIFLVIFVFMPESPIFLIKRHKMDKALISMRFLRGDEYDFSAEISEIRETEAKIQANPVSVCAALSRRASLKALATGIGLMFFQQLSGINAVIFYSTDIFKVAQTGFSPKICTIIMGVVQVIATLIAILVVDRLGRRILLLTSGLVMGLSTTALGYYFYMQDKDERSVHGYGWLPISSLCVFTIMFSVGYGPVPWLMMGELFSSDIKGVAASIVATFNWVLVFFVTKAFTDVKGAIGPGQTFWLFSLISFIGVPFVFFLVLETKGKSLNEIQKILEGEQEQNEM